MTPTQDYLERNPGVLAEMVAAFQQNKRMLETAKSKDPVDANVVDNPNLRAFIPYPKLLYNHRLRTTLRVEDAAQHEDALKKGWRDEAWHGAIDPGVPVGPAGSGSGMDDERFESLERSVLDLQQAIGDITATLSDIVKRLPKQKEHRGPQAQDGEEYRPKGA